MTNIIQNIGITNMETTYGYHIIILDSSKIIRFVLALHKSDCFYKNSTNNLDVKEEI